MAQHHHQNKRYLELAQRNAQLEIEVDPAQLPRFTDAVARVSAVRADLTFALDPDHRCQVRGQLTVDVEVACHWCLEPRPQTMHVEFAALVAVGEAQAQQWGTELQASNAATTAASPSIVVVEDDTICVPALIEDELLLQLPTKVCNDTTCEHRPGRVYGLDAQSSAQGAEDAAHNPFAVLAQLRDQ